MPPRTRYRGAVILEHAILPVTPGREADFEAALAEATPIIAGMPGFVDLQVSRSIERETCRSTNPGIPAMMGVASARAASKSASRPGVTGRIACSRITAPR